MPEAISKGDAVASLRLLRDSEESRREWDVVRGGGWRRCSWDGTGEAREMAGDCDESLSPKMASLFDDPSRSRSRSDDDSAAIPRDGALGVSSLSYDLRVEIAAGRSMAYLFPYLFADRGECVQNEEESLVCRRTRRTTRVTTSVDDGWACAPGPGSTL